MKRLAVIGLDAVEPRLVDRLIGEGKLPTLARLSRSGAHCRLHSESTWRSGRVWETLLTGTADFPSANFFDKHEYRSWQIGSRKKTPFYALMANLNVLAIDVPYMSLWYDMPGAQVIWGGHDAGYPRASRPPGLVREIDAKFGVHPAFHNDFTCAWWDQRSISTLADALVTGSRRRVEIIKWLHQRFPNWNLFMTVLSEAHSAGEIFWHGVEPNHPLSNVQTASLAGRRLMESYEEIDRAVAGIIGALPPDTQVLVTSVHGMEMNDYDIPSMALLPELLYRAEFGRKLLRTDSARTWRKNGCPAIVPSADGKWSDYVGERFGRGAVWRAVRAAGRAVGIGRRKQPPIHELVVPIKPEADAPPDSINEPRYSLEWQVTSWYRRFWPQMKAFALPVFYDGRVRVNLRGRDRHGLVEPRDYTATCDWVERLLGECRDLRTGNSIVSNIERRNATNPLSPDAADADLIITWKPQVEGIEHPALGTIGPLPYRRTGGHTDRGFAWLCGPGIASCDYGERDAIDLTATILQLLGHSTASQGIFRRRAAA